MVEFYYWREGSGNKSRLECVVLFLPDVWSAQPSRIEWSSVQDQYKAACDAAIRKLDGASSTVDKKQLSAATTAGAETAADAENCEIVCSQFCLVTFPAARGPLISTIASSTADFNFPVQVKTLIFILLVSL